MDSFTAVIRIVDEVEAAINKELARVAASEAPDIQHGMGMIDLAYQVKLITYAQRDVLIEQLRRIVNVRREELRKAHHERLRAEHLNTWRPEDSTSISGGAA